MLIWTSSLGDSQLPSFLTLIHVLCHFSVDLARLPSVYVRPVLSKDKPEKEEGEPQYEYQCPLFINKARQVCALMVGLNSDVPEFQWIMAGTSIILDPGLLSFVGGIKRLCRSA